MKRIRMTVLILLAIWLQPFHGNADTILIKLRNGSSVKTSDYSENGGKLYYEKYGTRIGLDKADVVEITTIGDAQGSSAAATSEYLGYSIPSKYFMVTGFPEKYYSPKCNGLYEQHPDIRNYRTFIHVSGQYHLFSFLESEGKPGWFVGQLLGNAISIAYAKPEAPVGSPPDGTGQWLAGSRKSSPPLPHVKIVAVPPPATAYEGVHAYIAEDFPFIEANGVYKPHRVYLGKILYKHVNDQFELFYQSRYGWIVKNRAHSSFAYYGGAGLSMASHPDQVKQWMDVHRRETNGRFHLQSP